jgi:hypothetical protein
MEIGHQALAFPHGLLIGLPPATLRNTLCEKAKDFAAAPDAHLLEIFVEAPFDCVMLGAPPVAWQRQ